MNSDAKILMLVNELHRLNQGIKRADVVIQECITTIDKEGEEKPQCWDGYESEFIFDMEKFLVEKFPQHCFAFTGTEWIMLY